MNEAFGFAIGAWGIGASKTLTNVQALTKTTEVAGAIARAIIGKQSGDGDAETSIVVDGSLEESGSGMGLLIGQD